MPTCCKYWQALRKHLQKPLPFARVHKMDFALLDFRNYKKVNKERTTHWRTILTRKFAFYFEGVNKYTTFMKQKGTKQHFLTVYAKFPCWYMLILYRQRYVWFEIIAQTIVTTVFLKYIKTSITLSCLKHIYGLIELIHQYLNFLFLLKINFWLNRLYLV